MFTTFLKHPRRLRKSVEDEDERSTVDVLTRALKDITSKMVMPQSATVFSTGEWTSLEALQIIRLLGSLFFYLTYKY